MSNFALHKVTNYFGVLFPHLGVYLPENTAGPGHPLGAPLTLLFDHY